MRTVTHRLKRIQEKLGVEPDGLLGPETLTALEKRLQIREANPSASPQSLIKALLTPRIGLTLTRSGIDAIVHHEVGSEAYYERALKSPTWPGGDSGVTIGIGYDLGYVTDIQFANDWAFNLPSVAVNRLTDICGFKGLRAKAVYRRFSDIQISLEDAQMVFNKTSLPTFCGLALKSYAGLGDLLPDAQVAIVSLVYNRGIKMTGDSRREMAAIQALVKAKNYVAIADQILSMKRLWQDRGLDGLLTRRDAEAQLVRGCQRAYAPEELVYV